MKEGRAWPRPGKRPSLALPSHSVEGLMVEMLNPFLLAHSSLL